MNKTAGLVFSYSESDDRLNSNADYINWLAALGFKVVVINPLWEDVEDVDLLVLPGGSDISPHRYGLPYHPIQVGLPNRSFEVFDGVALPKYIKNGQPIYATCRGFQSLNVIFGGGLTPHVSEPTSNTDKDWAHYVKNLATGKFMRSGSWHHQAVSMEQLAPDLTPLLLGYERDYDNVKFNYFPNESKPLHIEAFKHKTLPIVGVQTHVERQFMNDSCKELNNFAHGLIANILS